MRRFHDFGLWVSICLLILGILYGPSFVVDVDKPMWRIKLEIEFQNK